MKARKNILNDKNYESQCSSFGTNEFCSNTISCVSKSNSNIEESKINVQIQDSVHLILI